MMPDGYMTLRDAAEVLGLRMPSVRRLADQGRLVMLQVPWGTRFRLYVSRASVQRELKRRARGTVGHRRYVPPGVEERQPLWFLRES